jgi:hypothetical protein
MRLAVLLALLTACSGPISRPYETRAAAPEARVQRPPTNAPPDPIGTARPGSRSCTENRDCKAGDTCFAPDFAPASASQCRADSGCTEGQVCERTGCVAPCTETSCSPGQLCRKDGHCMAIPCSDPQARACPQNSRCNTASGACDRQSCTSRAQCDSGVCFQGRCYAHDAYCMPQSYCCTP